MQSPVSRIGFLALIVFAVAWAFYILRGPNGVPGWLQKRQRIQQLEERNQEMARQLELRREGIKTLEDYVPAQELEIRKRLKLVKPDEKIYVIGQ